MKKKLSLSTDEIEKYIFCRNKQAVSTELEGETVILNFSSGLYNSLDEVGTTIWNIIENPVTAKEIQQAILLYYDVDEEQCYRDLCQFLIQLDEQGLIESKINNSG